MLSTSIHAIMNDEQNTLITFNQYLLDQNTIVGLLCPFQSWTNVTGIPAFCVLFDIKRGSYPLLIVFDKTLLSFLYNKAALAVTPYWFFLILENVMRSIFGTFLQIWLMSVWISKLLLCDVSTLVWAIHHSKRKSIKMYDTLTGMRW